MPASMPSILEGQEDTVKLGAPLAWLAAVPVVSPFPLSTPVHLVLKSLQLGLPVRREPISCLHAYPAVCCMLLQV